MLARAVASTKGHPRFFEKYKKGIGPTGGIFHCASRAVGREGRAMSIEVSKKGIAVKGKPKFLALFHHSLPIALK